MSAPDPDPAAARPRSPAGVSLADLAAALDLPAPGWTGTGTVLTGVTLSSARVLPGDLYAAVPGAHRHGAEFAADAVAAGAAAVLTDAAGAALVAPGVPVLVVEDPRGVLGRVSAQVYGAPAESMRMLGVTGTQGKTTTTRLAEAALLRAGVRSACVGTVGTRVAGADIATALTTPEAPDLHGLFALMREREVEVCAMEVSSHALVLGRVDGVVFDVAVFLNLGRDHLDFHRDLDDYFAAKASLFTPQRARRALVSVDDEHGRRLSELVRDRGLPLRTMSATGRDADWSAVEVDARPDGSRFTVRGPGDLALEAGCALPGDFNVANALAAVAACAEAGLAPEVVARTALAMAGSGGVPGRLERVETGQDFAVVVDYAHKPDAVAAALGALRPLTAGRLLVVLGAGGDRDRGKRRVMGQVAAGLADVLVVTDDNPRTEEPAAIRAELVQGARAGRAEVVEIGDRRAAIAEALSRARPGDTVLIAGKGHETGQEVAGGVADFDDRVVARALLTGMRHNSPARGASAPGSGSGRRAGTT